MAGGGLGQDLPQLEGREDGADLRQEADDHQDRVRDQEAPRVDLMNPFRPKFTDVT
jgi:hypothetical protein